MDDDRIVISSGFVVTPETVASRTFTTSFRGFDQVEVRTFLKRVSEELEAAAEREAQLRRLLQEAQNRAAHPELDEAVLTAALGEQAARLLSSAREQAASIRGEAENKAARMLRETEVQISRVRAEADSLLARRVEEVDGVTANLRDAAEADARSLREQARAEAEAEIHAAKTQGREMVTEARAVRERILADLARRRHIAEVQLDQLRAARERLLEAYGLVRRTLDEATQELKMAEVEARLAAEDVGRRAGPPPPAPPPPPATAAESEFGPPSGPHEAVTVGSTPTGAASVATNAGGRAATTMHAPREPAPRPEARPRPPTRSNEVRPSTSWRRPGEAEPPARPDRAHGSPADRTGGARRAPEPPNSDSRPLGPPSMTPRPVPPPPSRSGPPAPTWRQPSPRFDPSAPPPAPEPDDASLAAKAGAQADTAHKGVKGDRVGALFARIKADRASVVAKSAPPAPPAPPEPAGAPAADATPGAAAENGADAAGGTALSDAPPASATVAAAPVEPAVSRDVTDEAARSRRDELLEPIEATLVRQLKRGLQDEQNEVLDRLRRKRREPGPVLPSAEQQANRFRDASLAALTEAVQAGARFAALSGNQSPVDPSIAPEVAAVLVADIVRPLRERLERYVQPGAEEPASRDDVAQVAESLSAVYRQWRAQELEPLARHQAVLAFTRGALAAYPDGSALRWVVDDDAPCPDCDDNELAGVVPKGEAYPTGQLHPPAHPGCRCLLVLAVP